MAKPKPIGLMQIYLREHVAYEHEMLGFSYARLHDSAPGYAWNMAYESFGIHARNLYDFFRNEGKSQTTFRADDYVTSWAAPSAFLSFNDLDVFLFHMSTSRADKAKLNLERLQKLGAWLDATWAVWVDRLPTDYQGILRTDKVCSQALLLKVGITPATACTAVTSSSMTFMASVSEKF